MNRIFRVTKFHPWVGEYYDRSPLGLKLLVMGESHYRCKDDAPADESITIETMKALRHTHSYWRNLARIIGEHQPAYQTDVWDGVAFYNYVQHIVGSKARQRPASYMWTSPDTLASFREVLEVLNPDRILVVGKANWYFMAGSSQLPQRPPVPETRFKLPGIFAADEHSSNLAYWYPTTLGRYALCAPIYHPAHPKGFHASETKVIVARLLQKWAFPSR